MSINYINSSERISLRKTREESEDEDFNGGEGEFIMFPQIHEIKRAESEVMPTGAKGFQSRITTSIDAVQRIKRVNIDHGTPRTPKKIVPRSFDSIVEELEDSTSMITGFGDYQLGTVLGKGSYGKVFKALNLKNGQFVAIKEISLTDSAVMADELPRILQEIDLLKQLKHRNIVRYIDFNMIENKCLHIVLEYIENGSLKDIIKKFVHFPEPLTARYCYQILQGLDYLHDLDILHRDIKGANILITKDGVCKLADFGVATKLHQDSIGDFAAGTIYWMAPEIFEMKEATKAADVWSFACLVVELLTGSPPYKDLPKEQAICKIIENDKPPYPTSISSELHSFLDLCFVKDPEERASIKLLLLHPWIQNNIRNYKNKKNSVNYSKDPSTINDLYDVLRSFNKPVNDSDFSRPIISDNDMDYLAENKPQELLQKLLLKNKMKERVNPYELDGDVVKSKFNELQEENILLLKLAQSIQQTNLLLAGDNQLKPNQSPEFVEKKNLFRSKKIAKLEESYATVQSDMKLGKLIYGSSLHMSKFLNGIRGVLLMKRAKIPSNQSKHMSVVVGPAGRIQTPTHSENSRHKWKKRYILLQDNFLLCYKAEEEHGKNPVLVMRLHNHKIVPIAEREIAKKYCFQLSTGKKSYYFAAANPQVLLKWINVLGPSEIVPWYQSEDSCIFNIEEVEEEEAPFRLTTTKASSSGTDREKRRASTIIHQSSKKEEEDPFPGIRLRDNLPLPITDPPQRLPRRDPSIRKFIATPSRSSITHIMRTADPLLSPRRT